MLTSATVYFPAEKTCNILAGLPSAISGKLVVRRFPNHVPWKMQEISHVASATCGSNGFSCLSHPNTIAQISQGMCDDNGYLTGLLVRHRYRVIYTYIV